MLAIAVRSARICASGTLKPTGDGSADRLYETLGNLPSTEGAVACGFIDAQNARCRHATRLTTAAKVPSDIARRCLAEPINPPPGGNIICCLYCGVRQSRLLAICFLSSLPAIAALYSFRQNRLQICEATVAQLVRLRVG